ncbi:MAG: hemolysin activation/secretion protein [Oceanicoccus sp.]|jgi:hemolysin activation/secretion protein
MKLLNISTNGFNNLLSRGLATSLLVISTVGGNSSFAQGFGSVTPGGVQPQLQRPSFPPETEQPNITLPPVSERPLDVDEGPVVMVKQFQFSTFENHPQDINRTEFLKLLEQQRLDHSEGFTIGQLQQVANLVTQRYREQGYILAKAYIPEQDVNDGVVNISVLVGRLGKVTAANNALYNEQLLVESIDYSSGQTLKLADMETALLRVNDLPGITVGGIFRPGSNIGEADLILNAEQEQRFDGSIMADNYGVETTGRERLIANLNWNNVSGNGDRLSATLLQTFDPEDSLYGSLAYELPLFTPAFSVGLSYSNNDYTIGQQAAALFDLEGETEQTNLYGRYSLDRSRTFNRYLKASLSTKQASVKSAGIDIGEDKLTVIALEAGFDSIDSKAGGGINRGVVTISTGLDDVLGSMDSNGDGNPLRFDRNGNPIGGDFNKAAASYSRLQSLGNNHSLLIRIAGQVSNDPLSSLEQYAMGGPNSVRAYPVSEYVRDTAFFTSLEWIINAPGFANQPAFAGRNWGEVLQVSLFADYAEGELNKAPQAFKEDIDISGAGISLNFRLPDVFYIRLDVATPLGSRDASNGDDPQYWLTTGFEF